MGLDITTKLIIGFPFEPGEVMREVPQGKKCPRQHVVEPHSPANFCGVCGGQLQQPMVRAYTDEFTKYAASVRYDAESLFNRWISCPNDRDCQLHLVDPLQYSGCGEGNLSIFALGFKLIGFNCSRPRDMALPAGVSIKQIQDTTELLEAVMGGLGIDKPIKLYLCANISY